MDFFSHESDPSAPIDLDLVGIFQDLLWPEAGREPLHALLDAVCQAYPCDGVTLSYQDVHGVWHGQTIAKGQAQSTTPHPGKALLAASQDKPQWLTTLGADPQERWQNWAFELGAEAALLTRLQVGERSGIRVATLGLLFSSQAPIPDELSPELDTWWTDLVGVALLCFQHGLDVQRALDSRGSVGQAQGILMQRYSLSATQALEVLKRYSSQLNRKLRDLAEQVIRSGELPDTPGTTPKPSDPAS